MIRKAALLERPAGPRHPGGRPRREVDLDKATALLEAGSSIREAARRLGLGYGTLFAAVRAAGLGHRQSPRRMKAQTGIPTDRKLIENSQTEVL